MTWEGKDVECMLARYGRNFLNIFLCANMYNCIVLSLWMGNMIFSLRRSFYDNSTDVANVLSVEIDLK